MAVALAIGFSAYGIVSINTGPGGSGTVINIILGADTFYNNGYFGQNTVIANVEGGAIWNGHETLGHVQTYISDPTIVGTQLGQFDFHATAVGQAIGGAGSFYYYQAGIAPLTKLWSASIAPTFYNNGSFDITEKSFIYGYKESIQVGRDVTYDIGGGISYSIHRVADVVNSSWGFDEPTGKTLETRIIDSLVYANHTTFVAAAGNSGPGLNTVGSPAAGFNKIAVAALAGTADNDNYLRPASFSSRGPNDFYNPKTTITTSGVRPVVDISAPGENLALAYYGGTTGTNTGGVDQSSGANNFYFTDVAGTSFAAPLVAGGAGLVIDYAYANFNTAHSVDSRVIKAVLLNSATKTIGWNNHQHSVGGVTTTNQGLDFVTGAGRMNLDLAYTQFSAGTTDTPTLTGGHVQKIGWAMGVTSSGQPTDYIIDQNFTAGELLTATLTWYIQRTFTDAVGATPATATDDRFDMLRLEIWKQINGTATTLIADSFSEYNNVQHLSLIVPESGQYLLRVSYAGSQYDFLTPVGQTPTPTDFAIAWSNLNVPEPTTMMLFPMLASLILRRSRRVRRTAV